MGRILVFLQVGNVQFDIHNRPTSARPAADRRRQLTCGRRSGCSLLHVFLICAPSCTFISTFPSRPRSSYSRTLSHQRLSRQGFGPVNAMESNKDEALKCLVIAQKHRNAGNLPSARRFCQKSLNLFATPEAHKLLEIIDSDSSTSEPSSASSSSSSASSATETHPSAAGTRHRHTTETNGKPNRSTASKPSTPQPEKKRDYTSEQAAVVKRIQSCQVTEYYEILSVKKDCEEVEIKKAYRKVRSL